MWLRLGYIGAADWGRRSPARSIYGRRDTTHNTAYLYVALALSDPVPLD
jgi:hypothetical protein